MIAEIERLAVEWSTVMTTTRFRFRRHLVPHHVLTTDSVLVPGATEEAILATEERIGMALPPSYRAFLRWSNGAYAGDGLELTGSSAWPPGPSVPRALLPVEAVGWAARNEPFQVDLSTEYYEALPQGQSTLHRLSASEVAYLNSPWVRDHVDLHRGQLYWSILIGAGDSGPGLLVLNPMVADAEGEWELDAVYPDGGVRYPSFGVWLEREIATERARRQDPGQARAVLADSAAELHARLGAVSTLLGMGDDLDVLADHATRGLSPAVGPAYQGWALTLLDWMDALDGGHRLAQAVRRVVDEPGFDELSVVDFVAASTDAEVPTVAEILARKRPADQARLNALPTADLVDRYRLSPDPTIAGILIQRGHPLVCDPVEVELRQRLVDHASHQPYLAPLTARDRPEPEDHQAEAAPGRSSGYTSDQIVAAATRAQLQPSVVAGALVRAGYPDAAVEYLVTHRTGEDFAYRHEVLARIDTPASWEALDAEAEPGSSLVDFSLLAAARTHSPLLASRAVTLLDGPVRTRLMALLALEIQPTQDAADALLQRWHQQSDLGALRALGRRRDPRIVEDATLLLHDPDETMRLVGAEVLRDLRFPSTVGVVTAALEEARSDDLTVVLAHLLAMLRATAAAPLLEATANTTSNLALADVLRRWAGQLNGSSSPR